jgi:hypothetical protein
MNAHQLHCIHAESQHIRGPEIEEFSGNVLANLEKEKHLRIGGKM